MALIKCPKCGVEVSDEVTTCPSCGTPLTPIPESVGYPRKGGTWDSIGFALVTLGIVIGVLSSHVLGAVVAIAGLAVFAAGRFR
jgi:hypothetical protein